MREALDLWRGPLLDDVADDETRRRRWHGLLDAHLAAAEQLADTELRLGRHERVVDGLALLVKPNPDRQRLAGLLILALHRCGRTAEALRVFDDMRRYVVREFGIDPSPDLQELHVAILRAGSEGVLKDAPARAGH